MVIKKYIVDNMKEAMDKISSELSPDATIVSTRKIKRKGMFKKKKLEVIAAYDDYDYYQKMSEKTLSTTLSYNRDVLEQVNQIKEMVSSIQNDNSVSERSIFPTVDKRNEIEELFNQYPFSYEVKAKFEKYINDRNYGIGNLRPLDLYQFVDNEVKNVINIDTSLNRKVNFFVGPTGVGKTTTIAKVASNEILNNNKKIALITLDTYRVAAAMQLKVYASILDIPLSVCYNKEDFQNALNEYVDYDYVFVDTTGRSSYNLDPIGEYIEVVDDHDVFLVVAPTIKYNDLVSVIDSYKVYEYDRIIFTKLDESNSHENILSIMYTTDKPISYLCFGQQVPSDISTASRELLMKYIWNRGK